MGKNIDSLGDRMKSYEAVSDGKLVNRVPVIIRIDGKTFHTLTKGINKPYDQAFSNSMGFTTKRLVQSIQNCVFGYSQSDEISLLVVEPTEYSDSWFGNRVQKIVSVSASMATAFFREEIRARAVAYDEYAKYRLLVEQSFFDARAFNVPVHEVANYFIWRQQDAYRNAVEGAAHANFPQKELNGLNIGRLIQKLKDEKNIEFETDFPDEYKMGKMVWRRNKLDGSKEEIKPAFNFVTYRMAIQDAVPKYGDEAELLNG